MAAVAVARTRTAHRSIGRVKLVPPNVAAVALRSTPRHVRNLVKAGYLTPYHNRKGRLVIDLDEIGDDTPRGRLDRERPFPHHDA